MYKLIVCNMYDFDEKVNDESMSSFEINQMVVKGDRIYIVMKDTAGVQE